MSKINAMVEFCAARGIPMDANNAHLAQVAKSLGFIAHTASVIGYKDKANVAPTVEGAKLYLTADGGARGRDCWFPVERDNAVDHARALSVAFAELADKLAK